MTIENSIVKRYSRSRVCLGNCVIDVSGDEAQLLTDFIEGLLTYDLGRTLCPRCGSKHVHWGRGYQYDHEKTCSVCRHTWIPGDDEPETNEYPLEDVLKRRLISELGRVAENIANELHHRGFKREAANGK